MLKLTAYRTAEH